MPMQSTEPLQNLQQKLDALTKLKALYALVVMVIF
jgi:hypothetical protein